MTGRTKGKRSKKVTKRPKSPMVITGQSGLRIVESDFLTGEVVEPAVAREQDEDDGDAA